MSPRFQNLVPPCIQSLLPYEPGKPLEEVERELGIRNCVKMASNENPLGPSPKAKKAIAAAINKIHFYPEGDAFYLRKRMVKALRVYSEELIFGNGSNELIELLIRCFVQRGDNVVVSRHAFVIYKLITQGAGGETLEAPATAHYGHDLDAMARLVNDRTKLVFIVNPNNPTGTYNTEKELCAFLEKVRHIPVVMDEAYFEYAAAKDYPQTMALRKKYPNIVILRTFSKAYGLAGLRIGYGIGDAELVQYLNRLRQPFNTNLPAQAAALAALDDKAHVSKSRTLNAAGLKFLYKELDRRKIPFLPSQANFILIKTGNGRTVFQKLLREGVVVRPMDVYALPDHIRVTIDTGRNNRRFLKALDKVLAEIIFP